MNYWGKLLGGITGFAVAGPFGAVVGAALGHAADEELMPELRARWSSLSGGPTRMGAMLSQMGPGGRDLMFTTCVVSLSAKLAKCDGPVRRTEIDMFKRQFRIPPESVRDVGRMFDHARDDPGHFDHFARQLADNFPDHKTLEDVLFALAQIARADGPINDAERGFLLRVHRAFGLDKPSWDRAMGRTSSPARPGSAEPDPYSVLGITAEATDDAVRAAWRQLVRDNHPDMLASRGADAATVAKAGEKVARINAAWDRVKRERHL